MTKDMAVDTTVDMVVVDSMVATNTKEVTVVDRTMVVDTTSMVVGTVVDMICKEAMVSNK